MGGRTSGWFQLLLAIVGSVMFVFWIFSVFMHWVQINEISWDGGPFLRYGIIGTGALLWAWFWGLASSVGILREAKQNRVPPPLPPIQTEDRV